MSPKLRVIEGELLSELLSGEDPEALRSRAANVPYVVSNFVALGEVGEAKKSLTEGLGMSPNLADQLIQKMQRGGEMEVIFNCVFDSPVSGKPDSLPRHYENFIRIR